MSAIAVRALVKDYGNLRAVDEVDFEVAAGEFFGLLGPNGAGKSTILNILAGLTRPTSGSASICGHDVQRSPRASRRNLGVVPQELVYESFFSVLQVMRWQSGYFGMRDNDGWIQEVLERLHLWEDRGKHGRQLSGGMKRRLLVAKALVHRPPVVILDEPTAGVDVDLRRRLWDFIRELHAAGTTILLTTHYLEEAETLCERVGILGRGRLLALERTENLLRRHTDREVVLTLREPLARVPDGLAPFGAELRDAGKRLVMRTHGTADRESLWHEVGRNSLGVVDVEVLHPDLEDVFLELTEGER